jgi:hypothetical protein
MGSMAMPTRAPSGEATRASQKPGCLRYLTLLLLVFILVGVVGKPWGLHMGGRWTPAMVWHGYGKMHASTGQNYMLWLNIGPMAVASRKSGRRDNFQGTATLCTPGGQRITLDVFGKVDAWLDAGGKPMTMRLATQRGIRPVASFRLEGQWEGQELELSDKGSMADSFRSDGTAKGYAEGLRAPVEHAEITLRYAKKGEFEAAESSF